MDEFEIAHILGREVLDSRGNPTVEVDVRLGRRRLRAGDRAVGRLDRLARGLELRDGTTTSAISARASPRRSAPSTARSPTC